MPKWERPGEIAISPRPGYRPGAEFTTPREVVDAWIEETRAFGIASIICLLDRDQLPLYERGIPQGLIAYYEVAGFAVAHIPTPDGLQHPFTPEQLDDAWVAYQRLPKPVLVHCSAGHDRTSRVVRHLLARLDEADGLA